MQPQHTEAEIDLSSALRAQIVGMHLLPETITPAVLSQAPEPQPGDPTPLPLAFALAVQGTVPVEITIAGTTHHAQAGHLAVILLRSEHVALMYEGIGRLLASRPELAEGWAEHRARARNTIADSELVARDMEAEADAAAAELTRPGHGGYV
jgi:hypothetical protein